jgi:acetyl-CoA carboxylase carboxyl transferase subunit beta
LPFIQFLYKPKNELEKGGRQAAPPVVSAENEMAEPCPNCHKQVPLSQMWENRHCCPFCGYHFRMNARQRLNYFIDPGSFSELDENLQAQDILSFPGYGKKLDTTRSACGEKEAVIAARQV